MVELIFNDLVNGSQISVRFSAISCGFYEKSIDTETTFAPEDGNAFATLLEEILASDVAADVNASDHCLVHRFRNLDGDEDAAFLVREYLGGIKVTLATGLENYNDLTDQDVGGTSACISRTDARKLADAFIDQLAGGL
jgi:hypothetical protein